LPFLIFYNKYCIYYIKITSTVIQTCTILLSTVILTILDNATKHRGLIYRHRNLTSIKQYCTPLVTRERRNMDPIFWPASLAAYVLAMSNNGAFVYGVKISLY